MSHTDARTTTRDHGTGITRRAVIVGGAAIAPLVLPGCVAPIWEGVDPTTTQHFVEFTFRRAEDQVELKFRFLNARLSTRLFRLLALAKVDAQRPVIVQVTFPSQYVLEQTFFETEIGGDALISPPVASELSGESRLVFEIERLPEGHLPLTAEHILDWTRWSPRLVAETVKEASLRAPDSLETAIEMPARIVLSPGRDGFWRSSSSPIASNGRNVLWSATLVGPENAKPTVRAVWTKDFVSPQPPFRTSLEGTERKQLVQLTHVDEYNPQPLTPDLLMLTSLGGWLDVDKSWPLETDPLPITAYRHRGAQGRLNFEQVEIKAVLFPFGFYVSLIETTERKEARSPDGQETAYLRKRLNIKFNEKDRAFNSWDFPLSGIHARETISPKLDWPTLIVGSEIDKGAFWVDVAGHPYEFPFDGVDHDGGTSTFTAPAICVTGQSEVEMRAMLAKLEAEYGAAANEHLRVRSFGAAQVAVAPSSTPGKTAVSLDAVEFGSKPGVRKELPFRGFEPIAQHMSLALTAASANKAIAPGTYRWFDPYDPEKPGNANEVYLQATPGRDRMSVDFGSHTGDSGGFAAPVYAVAGVSRMNGPYGGGQGHQLVGDSFAAGQYVPTDFFPPDATILGGIRLSWILGPVSGLAGDHVPSIVSEILELTETPPELRYSYSWRTDKLQDSPTFDPLEPIFLVSKDAATPTILNLTGEGVVPLDRPEDSYAALSASLENFSLQLVFEGNGIKLGVKSVSFSSSTDDKSRFAVDIGGYEFVGPMLEFVAELEETLGLFGDDSPVDISPSGVTVHLPSLDIPPIIVGALNIYNLSIRSGLSLPFDGKPIEFSFALSSPQDMFAVTVSIYGGAGYFMMVLDSYGVKQIDASFGFGAFGEINLAGGALKGSAFVIGGFSYSSNRLEAPAGSDHGPTTSLDYSAFVHAGGAASVLGLVTVGIDFHLGLSFDEPGDGSSRLWGYCDITYSIKVLFFSKSVSVHFEKTFSRSSPHAARLANIAANEPTPAMSLAQWKKYRAAFARAA